MRIEKRFDWVVELMESERIYCTEDWQQCISQFSKSAATGDLSPQSTDCKTFQLLKHLVSSQGSTSQKIFKLGKIRGSSVSMLVTGPEQNGSEQSQILN